MLLGPDPLGSFIPIAVKSIHRKRMPVKEVRGGQTASFALKKVCGKHLLQLRRNWDYLCLLYWATTQTSQIVHKKGF